MKLELERKEKTRARKIGKFRRRRSRRAGLTKGVGEAWNLERSGKVLLMIKLSGSDNRARKIEHNQKPRICPLGRNTE
jgi:hypothetical protein